MTPHGQRENTDNDEEFKRQEYHDELEHVCSRRLGHTHTVFLETQAEIGDASDAAAREDMIDEIQL